MFLEWGEENQMDNIVLAQYNNEVSRIFIETRACDIFQGLSPALLITLLLSVSW
jgi:hypothetical protein